MTNGLQIPYKGCRMVMNVQHDPLSLDLDYRQLREAVWCVSEPREP